MISGKFTEFKCGNLERSLLTGGMSFLAFGKGANIASSTSQQYESSMDEIVMLPSNFSTLTFPSTVVMLTECSFT